MSDQKKIVDVFTLLKPEIEKLKNAGSDTSTLDCRILLAHAMSLEKAIYTHQSINISEHQITNFKKLIAEREMGKPVSRITTKKNFWTKEFEINEETLDPRPDSEIIIDCFLKHYEEKSKKLKILDLGSGSGCLGLSILDEFHNSKVSFFDISKKSLEAVKLNALKYSLSDRCRFIHMDWNLYNWDIKLLNLERNIRFDVIVTNPPYIPSNEIKFLQKEVKNYEPILALDGGKDGMQSYRVIISKLVNLLKPNGKIFVEIGKNQEEAVSKIASKHGLFPLEYAKDLSGIKRVIVFTIN